MARLATMTPVQAAPSDTDPVVRELAEAVGGPAGEHSVRPPRRQFWTVLRVVLFVAIIGFAFAFLQKSPCRDGAWEDNSQYRQYCYTDVVALYYAENLANGAVPYRDHPVEYPVLTGVFMGALGLPVHWMGQGNAALDQARTFFDLNAVVLSLLGIGAVAAIWALRRRRPWDAMMLAAAPAIIYTATVNWDLLAVSLATFFLLAFGRKHFLWAGVLLGLAVAAKFYPLLFAGPMLLLAWRSRRYADTMLTLGTALLTWVMVNAPVALLWTDSWKRFFQLNSERPIDWGTIWYVLRFLTPAEGTHLLDQREFLNSAYLLLFVVACVGIAVLVAFAPRKPRLAQLLFLVLAAFLLTGKVWSQQYVLWLIPLAVLARPKWGAFLAWQAAELFYFLAFYGELINAGGGFAFPEWVFIVASLGRIGTVAVLCGLIIREMWRTELDVVAGYAADDDEDSVYAGDALLPPTALKTA